VRRGLAARFEGIPDVHYGEDDHFVCGNRGVSEWTISGTTSDERDEFARTRFPDGYRVELIERV
jgi:hypothetical protein